MVDGVGNLLIVKGPQILNGTAAPADDQKICQMIMVRIAIAAAISPGASVP